MGVCVEIARKFDALRLEGKRKYTCIYIFKDCTQLKRIHRRLTNTDTHSLIKNGGRNHQQ